jgi:hypothetical protein
LLVQALRWLASVDVEEDIYGASVAAPNGEEVNLTPLGTG